MCEKRVENSRCSLSYGLDNRGVEVSVPSAASGSFIFSEPCGRVVGPTRLSVQRLSGDVSLGVGSRSVRLTPHLQPEDCHTLMFFLRHAAKCGLTQPATVSVYSFLLLYQMDIYVTFTFEPNSRITFIISLSLSRHRRNTKHWFIFLLDFDL
jgi:hypothetical protein